MLSNNQQAFLALVRAGLWEKEVRLSKFEPIDFSIIYKLAQEQAVVGLFAAGLEHVIDIKIPKEEALLFVGDTLQLEQRNKAMNSFVCVLIEKMRHAGIYALLIKGQGIAQCYERPLWRACGDVDFFLSETNYELAKSFLTPLAATMEVEGVNEKHQGFVIGPWSVEIHGTIHCGLSRKMDRVLDEIQNEIFYGGNVRSWINVHTQLFLLGIDCDVIYIFSHLLKHFYKEGVGLRQVCDWCRLLWTYKDSVNRGLLEIRLKKMGLTSEWKAFGAFAVVYLGMPADAMPLYSADVSWKKKADKILSFIMEVGNMGHNRDTSCNRKYPYLVRKFFSMGRRIGDIINHARIFPIDSLRFFPYIVFNGVKSAVRGE